MPQHGVHAITGAGCCGWMARTGGEIWAEETGRGFGGGNPDSGGGISGSRVGRLRIGQGSWIYCTDEAAT